MFINNLVDKSKKIVLTKRVVNKEKIVSRKVKIYHLTVFVFCANNLQQVHRIL